MRRKYSGWLTAEAEIAGHLRTAITGRGHWVFAAGYAPMMLRLTLLTAAATAEAGEDAVAFFSLPWACRKTGRTGAAYFLTVEKSRLPLAELAALGAAAGLKAVFDGTAGEDVHAMDDAHDLALLSDPRDDVAAAYLVAMIAHAENGTLSFGELPAG